MVYEGELWKLLSPNFPRLRDCIHPTDYLAHLAECLPKRAREQIRIKESNNGAMDTFLFFISELERRPDGATQFLRAMIIEDWHIARDINHPLVAAEWARCIAVEQQRVPIPPKLMDPLEGTANVVDENKIAKLKLGPDERPAPRNNPPSNPRDDAGPSSMENNPPTTQLTPSQPPDTVNQREITQQEASYFTVGGIQVREEETNPSQSTQLHTTKITEQPVNSGDVEHVQNQPQLLDYTTVDSITNSGHPHRQASESLPSQDKTEHSAMSENIKCTTEAVETHAPGAEDMPSQDTAAKTTFSSEMKLSLATEEKDHSDLLSNATTDTLGSVTSAAGLRRQVSKNQEMKHNGANTEIVDELPINPSPINVTHGDQRANLSNMDDTVQNSQDESNSNNITGSLEFPLDLGVSLDNSNAVSDGACDQTSGQSQLSARTGDGLLTTRVGGAPVYATTPEVSIHSHGNETVSSGATDFQTLKSDFAGQMRRDPVINDEAVDPSSEKSYTIESSVSHEPVTSSMSTGTETSSTNGLDNDSLSSVNISNVPSDAVMDDDANHNREPPATPSNSRISEIETSGEINVEFKEGPEVSVLGQLPSTSRNSDTDDYGSSGFEDHPSSGQTDNKASSGTWYVVLGAALFGVVAYGMFKKFNG